LGALLWEQRPTEAAQPANPLGRVLLERRSLDWLLGIAVLVIGGAILTFLLLIPRPTSYYALGLLTLTCLMLGLSAGFFRRGASRIVFHERGVAQPTRNGTLALLHDEIGTVLWQVGPTATFLPVPGLDKPPLVFATSIVVGADDLAAMRDQV